MTPDDIVGRLREMPDQLRAEGFSACAVGGSVGRAEADSFSDVDIFLLGTLTGEAMRNAVVRSTNMFGGDCVLFRGPVWVEGFGYSFSTVVDDLLVQFNVNTSETLRPNPMGGLPHRVIFDDHGGWATFVDASRRIPIDWNDLFDRSVTFFWIRALLALNSLLRGQHQMVRRYLVADMCEQMLLLTRLRDGKPPMNPLAPGKWIERDLSEWGHRQLALIHDWCAARPADSAAALLSAVAWFQTESEAYSREQTREFAAVRRGGHLALRITTTVVQLIIKPKAIDVT